MKLTPKQKEYSELVAEKAPKSRLVPDMLNALWTGGLICCLGQFISDILLLFGMTKDVASTWSLVLLIIIAACLTGVGVYDKIVILAGAGSVVPITGFANGVVAPAIEFKQEGLVEGIGAKLFTIAGPVLVCGISASIIAGLIYYIVGLF